MDRHQPRDESPVREYHATVDCSACGKTLEVWGVAASGTVAPICPECVSPDRSPAPPLTARTPQREHAGGFLQARAVEIVDSSTAPVWSGNAALVGPASPNYTRREGVQAEFEREFHRVHDWPSEILPVETSPL